MAVLATVFVFGHGGHSRASQTHGTPGARKGTSESHSKADRATEQPIRVGVWRPRWGFGHGLILRLRERVGGGGTLNAFLLGVAFSFAFCPTLALLFFGYVIPTTIKSATGHLHGNPGSAVEQG